MRLSFTSAGGFHGLGFSNCACSSKTEAQVVMIGTGRGSYGEECAHAMLLSYVLGNGDLPARLSRAAYISHNYRLQTTSCSSRYHL